YRRSPPLLRQRGRDPGGPDFPLLRGVREPPAYLRACLPPLVLAQRLPPPQLPPPPPAVSPSLKNAPRPPKKKAPRPPSPKAGARHSFFSLCTRASSSCRRFS